MFKTSIFLSHYTLIMKRHIINNGINPSSSFMLNPFTLSLNRIKNNKKVKKIDSMELLYPELNLDPKKILTSYNITYISDLENNLTYYSNYQINRILKLLFFIYHKEFKNLNYNSIPNIINHLSEFYNLSRNDIQKKFLKINQNNFSEIFYKTN